MERTEFRDDDPFGLIHGVFAAVVDRSDSHDNMPILFQRQLHRHCSGKACSTKGNDRDLPRIITARAGVVAKCDLNVDVRAAAKVQRYVHLPVEASP